MIEHVDPPETTTSGVPLSSIGRKFFHLIEFDANEKLHAEIRKSPFGLILLETIGFGVSAVILLASIGIAVATSSQDGIDGAVSAAILAGGVVLAILTFATTVVQAVMYTNNVIYVTSDKVAQLLYSGLFNRKISQLSIGDVQDITVRQDGLLARVFNYGTLVIETAGEQSNYRFTFIPDPYKNSKFIVAAAEADRKSFGN